WSMFQAKVPWQNALLTGTSPIAMNYTQSGSFFGRSDLIQHMLKPKDPNVPDVNFAISGVPFSSSELAPLKDGAADLIDAPLDAAALAFVVEPPAGKLSGFGDFETFLQLPGSDDEHPFCDPDDPTSWPPGVTDGSQCITIAPLKNPIRIPARNLAAMATHYG